MPFSDMKDGAPSDAVIMDLGESDSRDASGGLSEIEGGRHCARLIGLCTSRMLDKAGYDEWRASRWSRRGPRLEA
jgi:hypothetical protein